MAESASPSPISAASANDIAPTSLVSGALTKYGTTDCAAAGVVSTA